jgi:hypothetical protein
MYSPSSTVSVIWLDISSRGGLAGVWDTCAQWCLCTRSCLERVGPVGDREPVGHADAE